MRQRDCTDTKWTFCIHNNIVGDLKSVHRSVRSRLTAGPLSAQYVTVQSQHQMIKRAEHLRTVAYTCLLTERYISLDSLVFEFHLFFLYSNIIKMVLNRYVRFENRIRCFLLFVIGCVITLKGQWTCTNGLYNSHFAFLIEIG